MAYAAGVDIGGTHIEGVRIDKGLRITKKARVDLPARLDKHAIISNLHKCLDILCKDAGLLGIGAAVPGVINNGVVMKSPNLPFLNGTDFRSMLVRKFRTRVVVDNDVNCMALGESVKRQGKDLVALTLGTGIGGGLIIDGKVHRGRSYAGEIGHMTIESDGPKCMCGNRGCFEEYVSVRSVRRLSAKFLGRKMEPHEVCELADKGNRKARRVWEEYGKMLGTGLANVCFILDPDVIVLGGGISKAYSHFRKAMRSEMRKRMFIPMPKIVTGKSYGNAYGAACMAMKP